MHETRVALAPFLSPVPEVVTLGVRACLDDYSEDERALLRSASRIFFPTPRYAATFEAAGKILFPNAAAYVFQRSRLHQQLLFQVLNLPRPRTRIYYGKRQKDRIPSDFSFPFMAMGPQSTPGSVHPVENGETLATLAQRYNPLIIQETVPWTGQLGLVFVQFECAGVQRLEGPAFQANSRAVEPSVSEAFREVSERTGRIVRELGINDICVQWGRAAERWLVAGMARPPVRWDSAAGPVRRFEHVAGLIRRGLL
jgi:hypothetical protein